MAQSETKTVVGIFEDYSAAESAARALEGAGIPRVEIQVQSHLKTGAAGSSGGSTTEHEGGIMGFFSRLFGGGEDAEHYAEAVRRGSAAVCVTATDEVAERAATIMNDAGAIDIDRRVAEYRQAGYARHDPNARPYSSEEASRERERLRADASASSIPVIEEDLRIGKRAVQRGGVRIYSQVVEQPVEEQVTLREEHVRVERRQVDRAVEPGDRDRMKDQTIEVREMAEEPVIEKRARVREEVTVGKEQTEKQQKVRDTVRRTEVKVDRLGAEGGDYGEDFRRDYEQNYATSGMRYEDLEPSYRYGYTMASDPRYKGRSWKEVEPELTTDYASHYPGSTWDKMKNAVRYGWDRVSGHRS